MSRFEPIIHSIRPVTQQRALVYLIHPDDWMTLQLPVWAKSPTEEVQVWVQDGDDPYTYRDGRRDEILIFWSIKHQGYIYCIADESAPKKGRRGGNNNPTGRPEKFGEESWRTYVPASMNQQHIDSWTSILATIEDYRDQCANHQGEPRYYHLNKLLEELEGYGL